MEECGIKSSEINEKLDFVYSFLHSTNLIDPPLCAKHCAKHDAVLKKLRAKEVNVG